jgi:hypothetical protein
MLHSRRASPDRVLRLPKGRGVLVVSVWAKGHLVRNYYANRQPELAVNVGIPALQDIAGIQAGPRKGLDLPGLNCVTAGEIMTDQSRDHDRLRHR